MAGWGSASGAPSNASVESAGKFLPGGGRPACVIQARQGGLVDLGVPTVRSNRTNSSTASMARPLAEACEEDGLGAGHVGAGGLRPACGL